MEEQEITIKIVATKPEGFVGTREGIDYTIKQVLDELGLVDVDVTYQNI